MLILQVRSYTSALYELLSSVRGPVLNFLGDTTGERRHITHIITVVASPGNFTNYAYDRTWRLRLTVMLVAMKKPRMYVVLENKAGVGWDEVYTQMFLRSTDMRIHKDGLALAVKLLRFDTYVSSLRQDYSLTDIISANTRLRGIEVLRSCANSREIPARPSTGI